MQNFAIALSIGIIAGIIDIVPMLLSKQDINACLSAFVHWVVLGLLIPFINWDLQPWLIGLIVAELTAIPVMILVFPKDPKALLPMFLFSAILGIGVGIAGSIFIG